MVFYFTATGNSLYAAKYFSDAPLSIPQVMRGTQRQFSDDAIGIVCPVYAGEPPKMVKEFLRESSFQADYFYFILTYGFDQTDAPEFTARLAAEAGVHADYIASILMVDNYLPMFDMAVEIAMDKHVEAQLTTAVQAVSERVHGIPEAAEEGRKLHAQVAAMNREQPAFNDGSQITVLDSCIGCGVCQSVCPVGNFYLEGGKARRKQTTCEFCLACAQNCPQKAIGLSMADKNPGARYRNPHISLQEIIQANANS